MYIMIKFVPFQENSVSINTGELMSMFWTIYDSCMVGSSQWKLLKGTIYIWVNENYITSYYLL